MAEDNGSQSTDTTSTGTEGAGSVGQEPTNQPPEVQDPNSLPDWVREQISTANNQAAKYRVEKNDAVEAAKTEVRTEFETKLQEASDAHEVTKGELDDARLEIVKLNAALSQEIPHDKVHAFAGLLQGSTEDEISTHAKTVKELFAAEDKGTGTGRVTDPSQGRGNHIPLNGDPILAALTNAVGARRR